MRYGETALMKAVWGGHDKCVDVLIKAGDDVNLHDDYRDPNEVWLY